MLLFLRYEGGTIEMKDPVNGGGGPKSFSRGLMGGNFFKIFFEKIGRFWGLQIPKIEIEGGDHG